MTDLFVAATLVLLMLWMVSTDFEVSWLNLNRWKWNRDRSHDDPAFLEGPKAAARFLSTASNSEVDQSHGHQE